MSSLLALITRLSVALQVKSLDTFFLRFPLSVNTEAGGGALLRGKVIQNL